MTQRGRYDVREDHWVTSPTWDADYPDVVGNDYANEIYRFDGDSWTIESSAVSEGSRTFLKSDEYP